MLEGRKLTATAAPNTAPAGSKPHCHAWTGPNADPSRSARLWSRAPYFAPSAKAEPVNGTASW